MSKNKYAQMLYTSNDIIINLFVSDYNKISINIKIEMYKELVKSRFVEFVRKI